MQRTCLSIAALLFRSQKQNESICASAHHDERLLTNSLVPHLNFFTVSSPVRFQATLMSLAGIQAREDPNRVLLAWSYYTKFPPSVW